MSIQESEIKLISSACKKLNINNEALFEKFEIDEYYEKEKYFDEIDFNIEVVCPDPCDLSNTCRGIRIERSYLLCPIDSRLLGRKKHIKMSKKFKFKKEILLGELKKYIGLKTDMCKNEIFEILGESKYGKRTVTFLFAHSNAIRNSELRVVALRNTIKSDVILIITDDIEGILSLKYNSINIYFETIESFLKMETKTVISEILKSNKHIFTVWDTLKEAIVENGFNIYSLSQLMNNASSANSIIFEDEIANKLGFFFDTLIPLGKSYSGISVPDGIAFYKSKSNTNILVYDCKSFVGRKFKTKSGDAQQQFYYLDFIKTIAESSNNYNVVGGMIISNSFEDSIRDTIYNSAPWRDVANKFRVFLLDVRAIETLVSLSQKFHVYTQSFFNREVFWNALIYKEIGLYSDIITQELLDLYNSEINYNIKDPNLEYINYLKIEFCFIYTILIRREENKREFSFVNSVVKKQNIGKTIGSEWSQLERDFIYLIRDNDFEQILIKSELHPLSLLLLSKGFNLSKSEVSTEFFVNQSKFEKFVNERISKS